MFTLKHCFASLLKVSVLEWIVLALMIAIGLASRGYLADLWNFKPIAALILFGGFYFRNPLISIVAVLAIMLPSDIQIGFYQWQIMISVYVSLGLSAGLGVLIRRRHGFQLKGWSWMLSFIGASLAMSSLFFIITNAAVWWAWYPHSWSGLLSCYTAAIPFFRPTLQSDLCFTALTAGCYAFAVKAVAVKSASDNSPVDLNVIRADDVAL